MMDALFGLPWYVWVMMAAVALMILFGVKFIREKVMFLQYMAHADAVVADYYQEPGPKAFDPSTGRAELKTGHYFYFNQHDLGYTIVVRPDGAAEVQFALSLMGTGGHQDVRKVLMKFKKAGYVHSHNMFVFGPSSMEGDIAAPSYTMIVTIRIAHPRGARAVVEQFIRDITQMESISVVPTPFPAMIFTEGVRTASGARDQRPMRLSLDAVPPGIDPSAWGGYMKDAETLSAADRLYWTSVTQPTFGVGYPTAPPPTAVGPPLEAEIEEDRGDSNPSDIKKFAKPVTVGYAVSSMNPVAVDIESMTTGSLVVGATGTGKTHAAGALVEGLLDGGVSALIIDPTGLWVNIVKPNKLPSTKKEIELTDEYTKNTRTEHTPKGYPTTVLHVGPPRGGVVYTKLFTIEVPKLTDAEFVRIIRARMGAGGLTPLQEQTLLSIREFVVASKKRYGMDDILDTLYDAFKHKDKYAKALRGIAITRSDLSLLSKKITLLTKSMPGLFSKSGGTRITEYMKPGEAVVVTFAEEIKESPESMKGVTAYIIRQLSDEWGPTSTNPEQNIREELTFVPILEEAHNLLPIGGEVDNPAKSIVVKLIREGRKHGMVPILLTQNPSDLDIEDVASNCKALLLCFHVIPGQYQYLQQLIGSERWRRVKPNVERIEKEVGVCIVQGNATNVPDFAVVRIKPRRSQTISKPPMTMEEFAMWSDAARGGAPAAERRERTASAEERLKRLLGRA